MLAAFIGASLQGCLEAHSVVQLSPMLARNQPDGILTVQALPSLVGELYPSMHEQVRDEGKAQSPVQKLLTPHLSWHALTDQSKHVGNCVLARKAL